VTFLISSEERYTFCTFSTASFNRPHHFLIPLLPLSPTHTNICFRFLQ
jgi:hypothetical protein